VETDHQPQSAQHDDAPDLAETAVIPGREPGRFRRQRPSLARVVVGMLGLLAVVGFGLGLWAGLQEGTRAPAAPTTDDAVADVVAGDASTGPPEHDPLLLPAGLAQSHTPAVDEEPPLVDPLLVPEAIALSPDRPTSGDLRIIIEAEPSHLRVWDNTKVTLRARAASGQAFSRFVWHFEDGSPEVTAEEVVHTFPESVRDRYVTVEAYDTAGEKVVVSKRLAVERLEVVQFDEGAGARTSLPSRPGPAAGSARLMLVRGPLGTDVAQRVVDAAIAIVRPDVVVLMGDVVGSPGEAALLQALDQAKLPVLVVPGPAEIKASEGTGTLAAGQVRDPEGRLVSLDFRPLSLERVLVINEVALVVLDSVPEVADAPSLAYARHALQKASVYPARVVLSWRPLARLVEGESVADRAYRLYEHMLRERTTLYASGASGVHFQGRYGGLRVASVGLARKAACERLFGTDTCQPGTTAVVDIAKGEVKRIFFLLEPEFRSPEPDESLPPEVDRYRHP